MIVSINLNILCLITSKYRLYQNMASRTNFAEMRRAKLLQQNMRRRGAAVVGAGDVLPPPSSSADTTTLPTAAPDANAVFDFPPVPLPFVMTPTDQPGISLANPPPTSSSSSSPSASNPPRSSSSSHFPPNPPRYVPTSMLLKRLQKPMSVPGTGEDAVAVPAKPRPARIPLPSHQQQQQQQQQQQPVTPISAASRIASIRERKLAAMKDRASVWKRPDVHAWSKDMKVLAETEFPDLPGVTKAAAPLFDGVCREIREHYANSAPFAVVDQVLKKMELRRHAVDMDLGGVVPAGLLVLVWFDYVKKINEPECYMHFSETLADMGTTCIQGDTHRLFSSLVALHRDLTTKIAEEIKK